jgi:hypothetical protein
MPPLSKERTEYNYVFGRGKPFLRQIRKMKISTNSVSSQHMKCMGYKITVKVCSAIKLLILLEINAIRTMHSFVGYST